MRSRIAQSVVAAVALSLVVGLAVQARFLFQAISPPPAATQVPTLIASETRYGPNSPPGSFR